MFYYINGRLALLDGGYAVVDAGGVGYKLTISGTTFGALSAEQKDTVKLYSYMAVREDGVELFGYYSTEELDAFKLLITVSGVGPKAAMSILSVLTPDRLAAAVCAEDAKAIAKAPGVGSKTAARVVLDLKGKLAKEFPSASGAFSE